MVQDSEHEVNPGQPAADVANFGRIRPPVVYLGSIGLGLLIHILKRFDAPDETRSMTNGRFDGGRCALRVAPLPPGRALRRLSLFIEAKAFERDG